MVDTKHTPGPWFVQDRFVDGDNSVLAKDGFEVADAPSIQCRKARNGRLVRRDIPVEEQVANIHLIAAAPELLEALRPLAAWAALRPDGAGDNDRILHAAGTWPITWGDATRAAAAIAKAEGRSDG